MLQVTTSAIRAWRALERNPTRHWVDWAVRELEAGRDGPNLRIVAGLVEPFNYFETTRFVDAAVAEIDPRPLDKSESIDEYSHELIVALTEPSPLTNEILSDLTSLCVATDYPKSLMPFYLLHFARHDLDAGDDQHYWDGADASNIELIVVEEARKWLAARAA